MLYLSTRGQEAGIDSSSAIVRGMAGDGGLFVPAEIPDIRGDFARLARMNYREMAIDIIKRFLSDFSEAELLDCVEKAYGRKFNSYEIAPITKAGDACFLELYHGPTLAFKDMALTILPLFLRTAVKKLGIEKEIVVLTATSGDTGKAALEGFGGVEGTRIVVFYPDEGVSKIQQLQMVTQGEENTLVVGIRGNFDDAQNGVKEIFNDVDFKRSLEARYLFSSANSINIGRLVPQIVYYVYSYFELVGRGEIESGEAINIAVPTGNFGNILAAWYAREMGLPVNRLICASNENNVLYDFIKTGIYNKNREFKTTISPSMDILVSSNLERLLFEIGGRDSKLVEGFMADLKNKGSYEITDKMMKGLEAFYPGYADDKKTLSSIKELYTKEGYLMDTHTAVAWSAYRDYVRETGDPTSTLIVSTASPFKFPMAIAEALGLSQSKNEMDCLRKLEEYTGLAAPESIKKLETKRIAHRNSCSKDEMKEQLKKFLGV